MSSVVKEAVTTISDVVKKVMQYKDRAAASLTKFTKDANIIGRVYIDEAIAQDDIAIPLMGVLNQMYVSYVLTALHLDVMVVGGRTVREIIGKVSSEGYHDAANIILNHFGKENLDEPMISLETGSARIEDESQRLVCGRLIELDMHGHVDVTDTRTDYGPPDKDPNKTEVRGTSKTEKQSAQLFRVYIYVQLIPYILDTSTSEDFFSFNFVPGFLKRWRQLRAGEIKFFRDFIFAKDLIAKQKTAIKKDKDGILVDMMLRQKNALWRWAMQASGIRPENHNAASAICVISKQAFDKACAESRIDFSSNSVRQRFFTKTFTMLVVVVDPMYGTAEMYINGVNAVGKYTFDMINKVGSRGRDSFDLKQIMQALNQGMTPKF